MNRKPLSKEDRAAAAALRRIWNEKKEQLHLTQAKAADEMGFETQGAVSHYLRGYTPLNTDAILGFAKLLQVDPAQIRPDVDKLLDTFRGSPATVHHANTEAGPEIRAYVPLISFVQAGHWREAIDNLTPGRGEQWVPTTAKVSKNAYALRVKGDSMENPAGFPTFPEGAIIIVDPNVSADHGRFVIVRMNGANEATFKQLVIDGGRRFLKPLNPRYPVIELSKGAEICGVVRRMEMDFD